MTISQVLLPGSMVFTFPTVGLAGLTILCLSFFILNKGHHSVVVRIKLVNIRKHLKQPLAHNERSHRTDEYN